MARPLPQRALARRALIEQNLHRRHRWLQHGIAVLAVSVLGVGVAGSIVATGSASLSPGTGHAPSSSPTETAPRTSSATTTTRISALSTGTAPDGSSRTSRSRSRRGLTSVETADPSAGDAQSRAVRARAQALAATAAATRKRAAALAERHAKQLKAAKVKAKAKRKARLKADRAERARRHILPVAHYHVAARFGQVGSWARYHTGFDFSAPIGTAIHAPEDGVVTTAGSGEASGWAGTYVTIRHPDGTSSLYAHMSSVSVHQGEHVSGGDLIGRIGMTGRSFGPHLHFEVYPAGVTPGDIYRAVNPEPWLRALGLRP